MSVLQPLKSVGLSVVRFAIWIVRALRRQRRAAPSTDETSVLRELARHNSAPVSQLSSRLQSPPDATMEVLTNLEERGLVQLSPEKGVEHIRIAALTAAGRRAAEGGSETRAP
jgi:DNA-binding MarR family transcriptional regulator